MHEYVFFLESEYFRQIKINIFLIYSVPLKSQPNMIFKCKKSHHKFAYWYLVIYLVIEQGRYVRCNLSGNQ